MLDLHLHWGWQVLEMIQAWEHFALVVSERITTIVLKMIPELVSIIIFHYTIVTIL